MSYAPQVDEKSPSESKNEPKSLFFSEFKNYIDTHQRFQEEQDLSDNESIVNETNDDNKTEENSPDLIKKFKSANADETAKKDDIVKLINNFKKKIEAKLSAFKKKTLINSLRLKILHLKKLDEYDFYEFKTQTETSQDKLDCDSYLFASFIMEYVLLFFFFTITMLIFFIISIFSYIISWFLCFIQAFFQCVCKYDCKCIYRFFFYKITFKDIWNILFLNILSLFILLYFIFLTVPCFFVFLTQFMCINQLFIEQDSSVTELSNAMIVLKFLMVLFFLFLSMKEVSNALDVIGYFFMEFRLKKEKYYCLVSFIVFLMRIIPQLFQVYISFKLSYINIFLIYKTDDTTSLIQNFAGLAVLLEFDNFIMAFMRYIRFFTFYDYFLRKCNSYGGINKNEAELTIQDKQEKKRQTLAEYEEIMKSLKLKELQPEDIDIKKKQIEKKKTTRLENKNDIESHQISEKTQIQNISEKIILPIFYMLISYIEQDDSIKQLLCKTEFTVGNKLKMNEEQKNLLNIFGFFIIIGGSLGVTYYFYYYTIA